MGEDLSHVRREYTGPSLLESELAPEPVEQFRAWFAEAERAGVPDANAMTLATADADGAPGGRIVLLKGVDESGFLFFTHYESPKGRALAANPRAALVFHWPALERQVRVEGRVHRIPEADSDAYFRSRPRGSQLGALVSSQSAVIRERDALERALERLDATYAADAVPRPGDWGGYRVAPHTVELWQGRPNRLHDRIRYRGDGRSGWVIERLAP